MYETPQTEPLDVPAFLDRFLPLVKDDVSRRDIDLQVDVAGDVTTVRADARALQQVLINIITNAMDAVEGKDAPRIAIRITRSAGLVHIRVIDNGCGMGPEALRTAFLPFHTHKEGGTGLGLVIVRKMLAQMDGTVELNSREGDGTTVHVTLRED